MITGVHIRTCCSCPPPPHTRRSLTERCWHADPLARPSAQELASELGALLVSSGLPVMNSR